MSTYSMSVRVAENASAFVNTACRWLKRPRAILLPLACRRLGWPQYPSRIGCRVAAPAGAWGMSARIAARTSARRERAFIDIISLLDWTRLDTPLPVASVGAGKGAPEIRRKRFRSD